MQAKYRIMIVITIVTIALMCASNVFVAMIATLMGKQVADPYRIGEVTQIEPVCLRSVLNCQMVNKSLLRNFNMNAAIFCSNGDVADGTLDMVFVNAEYPQKQYAVESIEPVFDVTFSTMLIPKGIYRLYLFSKDSGRCYVTDQYFKQKDGEFSLMKMREASIDVECVTIRDDIIEDAASSGEKLYSVTVIPGLKNSFNEVYYNFTNEKCNMTFSTSKELREDMATRFPDEDCMACGAYLEIDRAILEPGEYTLQIYIENDGELYASHRTYDVAIGDSITVDG